jgi:hypothetical protein
MTHRHGPCIILLLASLLRADPSSRDVVLNETLHPYSGPVAHGVDPSTMTHKILAGYQGWHATPCDGLGRGWYHWVMSGELAPGNCKFDLWPDVSELDADEKCPTAFKHADGSTAFLFSAQTRKTVLRHFKWMQDYGIDGVFVQRFITETLHDVGLRQWNTVLDHCREGANTYGRTYAVMYDLSGLGANSIDTVINDWKLLCDRMQITKDPAYLHHNGHPVVVVWGFGFNDGRKYTLDEGMKLVDFLKHDEKYGHNTVMLGVPTYWRTLNRDTVNDPKLLDLIASADLISPWMVGRFHDEDGVRKFAGANMLKDLAWCAEHHIEYDPVAYPGFSWHNMNAKSPLDQIPRHGGAFLWSQYYEYQNAGCTMLYQAMFDEVDEGTAIYKVTNDPPVGASQFLTYEGLPSDHYLKLMGLGTKMLRGETPLHENLPLPTQGAR